MGIHMSAPFEREIGIKLSGRLGVRANPLFRNILQSSPYGSRFYPYQIHIPDAQLDENKDFRHSRRKKYCVYAGPPNPPKQNGRLMRPAVPSIYLFMPKAKSQDLFHRIDAHT